jgi:hypothetical protein
VTKHLRKKTCKRKYLFWLMVSEVSVCWLYYFGLKRRQNIMVEEVGMVEEAAHLLAARHEETDREESITP